MLVLPEKLPFHLAKVDAANGQWIVFIENPTGTQSGEYLLLNLTLEQSVDEETFQSRELSLVAPAPLIFEAETSAYVIGRIREWLETTEGDGFLDLVHI